ncbi:hypothetical protein IQ457_01060 [Psychrobacter sp. M9-54-1]|uniref:hypothetical protein n=1 Tax=Psychrobacter sp. M9-54-1 TaxID=2782386 RepID=UPI00190AC0BB|nr:hypothetical protein [Psychrobacter sp. M9-54-1]MBK3392539.1 hypothetical protein [Psychrobacter sp. M9-54-1]
MSKDNKSNSKSSHGPHSNSQPQKRGLLLRFIVFMAWVIGIGLLISLVACQPNNPKIFVIEEVAE